MKRYEFDGFKARGLNGGHYLSTKAETLEGVKQEIDESNARAMSLGYQAESWIITHYERYVWYDDNDMFIKSEDIEQTVEVYPARKDVTN